MSWFARRLKAVTGCEARGPLTVASATNLSIPDGAYVLYVSGTTAVSTLLAQRSPGRVIILVGTDATGPALANNNDTTTEGQMDLGGSPITLAAQDMVGLLQKANGAWVRVFSTNN